MVHSDPGSVGAGPDRSEEHTSELQSLRHLVCRLLLEKKRTRPPAGHPGRPYGQIPTTDVGDRLRDSLLLDRSVFYDNARGAFFFMVRRPPRVSPFSPIVAIPI